VSRAPLSDSIETTDNKRTHSILAETVCYEGIHKS
jgi:hypothetical protein